MICQLYFVKVYLTQTLFKKHLTELGRVDHFFMLTIPCYHCTFGYFVFKVLFFMCVCFLFSLVVAVACRFVFPIFLLFPLYPASLPVLLPPHHQGCVHLFILSSFGLPLRKLLPKNSLKHWRVSCLCTLPLGASIDAPACLPS